MDDTSTPPTLTDYATHSDLTDPGRHAAALAQVPIDLASIHQMVTDVVVHYRSRPLSPQQQRDIDRRWVSAILDAATERQPEDPLGARPDELKVAGCCRDHSLLSVAVLREHGVPARTRLGFAGYLGTPGFHHDHVIVERHDGERWVRFDPELDAAAHDFDVQDLPQGRAAPFATAAEVWLAHREGHLDLAQFGALPGSPLLTGAAFVYRYVLGDLAHRQRCELLLWDTWGAMSAFAAKPDAAVVALTDQIAELSVQADAGEPEAEAALTQLWADERIRPGRHVITWSPTSGPGRSDLVARTTTWAAPGQVGAPELLVQSSSGSM